MSGSVNMKGEAIDHIKWLPCIPVDLNDECPQNGWLVTVLDDGLDPSIEAVIMVGCGDWVDDYVKLDHQTDQHSYLFLPVIIDPMDM